MAVEMLSQHVAQAVADAGLNARIIARTVEIFRAQQARGAFPGGQLVVRRNGKLIVSEALGLARGFRAEDREAPLHVQSHTPFPAYSCGKPLAAIAVAMLEDRGRLDVLAPIAEVFPEFGRNGKEKITTLDVLTHRSGILLPELLNHPKWWSDRDTMANKLVEATPVLERGTLAYAPWEFGWILMEVVERIDGRRLVDFVEQEIAVPLGLPSLAFGLSGRDPCAVAHAYWFGKERVMVAGVNVAYRFEETNNARAYFDSLNPACTLITDADSLAIFYDFLLADGITASGKSLISGRVLRQYTCRNASGFCRSLRTYLAVGRGFTLGTLVPSIFGWWNTGQCFGHGGNLSCLAGADYRTGVSIAMLTNGNRSIMDFSKRVIPITHRIRQACLKAA
jgi:CubicO group peptidase (beta-lactamase class C family)